VETSTLPDPPGAPKLRLGIVADLHLPATRASIERYAPGAKRLHGLAGELAERYLPRLESLGADAIVLLGDLVDPCTPETLAALRRIMEAVSVPCHPIIGNHEPWSPRGEELFYRSLGLPAGGYYVVRTHGVRLILLSTPTPDALGPGSGQLAWLRRQLADVAPDEDVALFSHFSLLLHPCVAGAKNDGYQLLDHHRELLTLLSESPRVRVFSAGHKNVPSRLDRDGVVHLLSPQLIQAPCGYDMLSFYDDGLGRTTYEIDEQHYCEVARAAYEGSWPERYGQEDHRNFCLAYR
jgi:3',5'-cyclic AMP phosphodiesterase CpdA